MSEVSPLKGRLMDADGKPVQPFSIETLNFFAEILSERAVALNNENFDEVARIAGNARRELLAALVTSAALAVVEKL